MEIEPKQIKQIQTIMSSRFADRDERLDFISATFEREINSTKDLTAVEADELIYYLNTGKRESANWAVFDDKKFAAKRKYLWSLLYQAQWTKPKYGNFEVPDTVRLSNFLKSPKSPVQKPLKQWNAEEWSKIIFVFERIAKGTYS